MARPANSAPLHAPDVRGWSLASAAGRIGIGIGMLAAPSPALRALGFDRVSPATIVLGRIAGVRDLILGVVTLAALEDRDRLRTATLANAVADAGDTLAFSLAVGTSEQTAGSRGIAAALPAALAGVWTAWRLT